jgi:hypothetical protein
MFGIRGNAPYSDKVLYMFRGHGTIQLWLMKTTQPKRKLKMATNREFYQKLAEIDTIKLDQFLVTLFQYELVDGEFDQLATEQDRENMWQLFIAIKMI